MQRADRQPKWTKKDLCSAIHICCNLLVGRLKNKNEKVSLFFFFSINQVQNFLIILEKLKKKLCLCWPSTWPLINFAIKLTINIVHLEMLLSSKRSWRSRASSYSSASHWRTEMRYAGPVITLKMSNRFRSSRPIMLRCTGFDRTMSLPRRRRVCPAITDRE